MFKVLNIIANLFLLLNFILFITHYKKQNKSYKIFTFYLGYILVVQLWSHLLIKFGYQNLVLSHAYFTGQFILLSLFYKDLMKLKLQKLIIKWNLIAVLILISGSFLLNYTSIFSFNMFEIVLTSIPIILYCTFHLYNLLSDKKVYYFITCGVLLYLFGSTITFLPRNIEVFYGKDFDMLLQLMNVSLYLVYLLFIFINWVKIFKQNTPKADA